jgi:hypothetical protein
MKEAFGTAPTAEGLSGVAALPSSVTSMNKMPEPRLPDPHLWRRCLA